MKIPSLLRISEIWGSLQVLCMAVSCTELQSIPNLINDVRFFHFLGGADTTVSAKYAFFLAMVLFPSSYPTSCEDLNKQLIFLPRCSEKGAGGTWRCCRWRTITRICRPTPPTLHQCCRYRSPTLEQCYSNRYNFYFSSPWATNSLNNANYAGVPHMAMEDGVIGGYFIPKGSHILTNLWYVHILNHSWQVHTFLDFQGICYMTPRLIPTLLNLIQSVTFPLQERKFNGIHARYVLGTRVGSVPECISPKPPFSLASQCPLPFSILRMLLWMGFPSFQSTRVLLESSGFCFFAFHDLQWRKMIYFFFILVIQSRFNVPWNLDLKEQYL